jgi:topoisomerase-4 subunit B
MADLFASASPNASKPVKKDPIREAFEATQPAPTTSSSSEYTAQDIEVLEGLEPVRRRPGMYVGGTDENALHHLVAEIFDNSMDEAVAGHATRIELEMHADGCITVRDNGRGIPVDPHPKFPDKSALEVILTTLHSGGKFSNKAYETSGGLHGVGISVVNALSDRLEVEVARDKTVWKQSYSRGNPVTKLEQIGTANNRRGTSITFHPDEEIFDKRIFFRPHRLYNFAKSKAYLYKGVEIRWICDPILLSGKDGIPAKESIHFPGGLKDYLTSQLEEFKTVTEEAFLGEIQFPDNQGRAEWALHWIEGGEEGFIRSFCNTIPTAQGGTHESGLRSAILKGLRAYGEMTNNKKAAKITGDDILTSACIILSVFIRDPQFQGQTKEKLVSHHVVRLVENAIRDHFDHWLSGNTASAEKLLNFCIDAAEERLNRKQLKDVNRKSATTRLRLPGKLADCSKETPEGTELFIVEGDSAGGSAKMARDRATQAILPLRGKILNVASATVDKIRENQELADLLLALGCATGNNYEDGQLRYEKIIIMTDADVDGAHIASLLMTFFFCQTPELIKNGHLYLAQPPLFRLTQGTQTLYATDEQEKNYILEKLGTKKGRVDVGRFKGLGEMTAKQLKETTMDRSTRTLLKVSFDQETGWDQATTCVNDLMGKKPELRFKFIQERSKAVQNLIDSLDV